MSETSTSHTDAKWRRGKKAGLNRLLGKLVPTAVKHKIKQWAHPPSSLAKELRSSLAFPLIGEPATLYKEVFGQISDVPGWFNVDDCAHFHLILTMQTLYGIQGDIFEIGSYHGRSTAFMSRYIKGNERIVVCDAFEADTDDRYADKPSASRLLGNIRRVSPGLEASRIVIHECLSNEIVFDEGERFRFAHIDGGHSSDQVRADLALCTKHLVEGGIMAVDDYGHRDWPGVTEGVNLFLENNRDVSVVADLNRHGAIGRKIYLAKAPRR